MIRPLTQDDRSLFLTLAEEFYHSPAVLRPIPAAHFLRTWEELMRPDGLLECCILEWEGAPAGYALLIRSFSQEAGGPVLWVDELYVRPAFRGRGLGRRLLAEISARPGLAGIRLEVEPENTRAAALYEKLGFQTLPYKSMVLNLRDFTPR